ncbi:MAG: hypothetical protein F6K47_24165 [Symploca sp. SIO2E6]|nr:hypothetical protein [Symploca sp. SIO2E6]
MSIFRDNAPKRKRPNKSTSLRAFCLGAFCLLLPASCLLPPNQKAKIKVVPDSQERLRVNDYANLEFTTDNSV